METGYVRGTLKRRWLKILGVTFAGSAVFGMAMLVTKSWWFGGLLFAFIAACNFYYCQIKCPRCGDPLFWRPLVPGSQLLGYWSPIIPARCPRCELPL